MEKTRIAKINEVTLCRRGEQALGSLHLTPHHMIFSHIPPAPDGSQNKDTVIKPRELWITYPIISFCTLRPASPVSRLPSSIRVRCRDFTFACFYFADEANARTAYDTIKTWTCKVGRIDKLYAFSYQPPLPERKIQGWKLYNAREEWARLGVGGPDSKSGWRVSGVNIGYSFSPTYPALLPVPASMSDSTINHAAKYRSKARIPVLTYLHPVNNCSITRSSQPLVGVRGNRSVQDEKLLAAIFGTSQQDRPLSSATPPSLGSENSTASQETASSQELDFGVQSDFDFSNAEELEDEVISSVRGEETEHKPRVYGAQQHNLIVDARPTVNAFAMQAVGLGSENMENYKFATKAYLGIDNIHVMRDSLNRVVDALKDSDLSSLPPNREQLAKSGWLKHIVGILDGAALIARQIGLQHSHVLIHCSDGWDRTSQLSALSQLCLDPYYRTMKGFMVLVEKDWLSFGHMFRHRSGHLNSEKWFMVENDKGSNEFGRTGFSDAGSAGKAIENAFLSAKGFFNRDNASRDSLAEPDQDIGAFDGEGPRKPISRPRSPVNDTEVTKTKEISPVFHQFLDATYQLLYQHPTRFEFNERFLRRLLYHLYSCQYGTFLFNNEKERVDEKAMDRTQSVWDYFLSRKEQFLNPKYDPLIDDNKRGHERLLFPQTDSVRWWHEVFGRTDSEMNGGPNPNANSTAEKENIGAMRSPVLTVVENAQRSRSISPTAASPRATSGNATSTGLTSLASGLSNLGIGGPRPTREEAQQSAENQKKMEVEMQ